jgi:hypothetical protein
MRFLKGRFKKTQIALMFKSVNETRVTRRVPLMELELHTLPEHISSPPGFYWGSCFSIFNFLCGDLWSFFVLLSFLCWSLIVLSVLLRITKSVYPFASNYSYDDRYCWFSLIKSDLFLLPFTDMSLRESRGLSVMGIPTDLPRPDISVKGTKWEMWFQSTFCNFFT